MLKRWKRVMGILLGASMVLGMTACGGTDTAATGEAKSAESTASASSESAPDAAASDGETVTLNVWHQWSNDTNELKAKYEEAVAAYMEENPNVVIHSETLDTESYKTKLTQSSQEMRMESTYSTGGVQVRRRNSWRRISCWHWMITLPMMCVRGCWRDLPEHLSMTENYIPFRCFPGI